MSKLFILLLPICLNAQIGINTTTPQASLHVFGDVQISKSLSLGGTHDTPGEVGEVGALLKSNGSNAAPEWTLPHDLNIPISVAFAYRKNQAETFTANTEVPVVFSESSPSFHQNLDFISYDELSGKFTVLKDGYYQITSFIRVLNDDSGEGFLKYSLNSSIHGSIIIFNNNFGSEDTFDENKIIDKTFSESRFFTVGEEFWVAVSYDSDFSISDSSLSITYFH